MHDSISVPFIHENNCRNLKLYEFTFQLYLVSLCFVDFAEQLWCTFKNAAMLC